MTTQVLIDAAKEAEKALASCYDVENFTDTPQHRALALPRTALSACEPKVTTGYMQAPMEPSPVVSPHSKGVFPKPDEPVWSEWIDWSGGECPIPWATASATDSDYQIRYGDGELETPVSDATGYDWSRYISRSAQIWSYRYRLDRAPKE